MAKADYYKALWNKRRKERDAFTAYNYLMEIDLSEFVYEGLPDTVPAEFMEAGYRMNGTVVFGKVRELGESSPIYCAPGAYNGNYNGYLPDSYTAAVLGVGEISGKWYGDSPEVVVGCNNLMRAPDFDIVNTAESLAEIELSEAINVIFSRFLRIPYADNETERDAILAAIDNIIKGNIKAYTSRNAIKEYLTSGTLGAKADKFLDLVDVDKVRDLQYLTQYRDNKLKQYLMRRGYMFNVTSKLAQQTTDEIHGSDTIAMIYPLEQLECRRRTIEKCNELFGWEASVDLNPLLKRTLEDILADPEQDGDDEPPAGENEETEETEDTTGEEAADND